MDKLYPEELQQRLQAGCGRRVALVVTRNLRRFVSFRADASGVVRARVQEAFLEAPEAVLAALAGWVGKGRGRCPPAVREFIRSIPTAEAENAPLRPVTVRTAGACHDLAAIFARVNREFFAGAVAAPITWGRCPSRRVRHRRLGSWNARRGLISINPALDRPEVP